MSDSWAHRCLVVPDSHVELACQLTVALAGDAGAGMWTTPTGDLTTPTLAECQAFCAGAVLTTGEPDHSSV